MRLYHLLSKENSSIVGRHSSYPVRTTPSWCTGGSVEVAGQSQVYPLDTLASTRFVFSSVLREPTRFQVLDLGDGTEPVLPLPTERPARIGSANDVSSNRDSSGSRRACGPVRCPLRTAEQARASLFFQATKSQRWMPWRQEPMKDVSDCEKLRGTVY